MANRDCRNRRTKLSNGFSGKLPHARRLRLLKMGVEPGYAAADAVAAMFGLHEHVAFVFVNYQLRFYAESLEGVPEFVGLRRRAFAVAVADDHQRGGFSLLYECYRRA